MDKLVILPTTKCNISCGPCGQDRRIKNQEMDDSLLEELLSEVKERDIPVIMISGGEVTIPGYRDRLFRILRDTEVGKHTELLIETNGWWGETEKSTRRLYGELEEAFVSKLLLSTDHSHEQFIPAATLINVISGSEDSSVDIEGINVRSFKSTYWKDIELMKRIAQGLGEQIEKTQIVYQPSLNGRCIPIPWLSGEENSGRTGGNHQNVLDAIRNFLFPRALIRSTTEDGLFDVFEHEGGFEGLRNVLMAVYSVGENSSYDGLKGAKGINFCQMWAVRVGCARLTVDRNDVIKPIYPGIDRFIVGDRKRMMYLTMLVDPAVMPDGSLVPHCSLWSYMNDYKRSRIGKYPKMDLAKFERVSESPLFQVVKACSNMATYFPSRILDFVYAAKERV